MWRNISFPLRMFRCTILSALFLFASCRTTTFDPSELQEANRQARAFDILAFGDDYLPRYGYDRKHARRVIRGITESTLRDQALILSHAGAVGDAQFLDLVSMVPEADADILQLAIWGYDYNITGNEEALDALLESEARHFDGEDSDELLISSYMNEWELTIEMVKRHEPYADGTLGFAIGSFWARREFLFHEKYAAFMDRAKQ